MSGYILDITNNSVGIHDGLDKLDGRQLLEPFRPSKSLTVHTGGALPNKLPEPFWPSKSLNKLDGRQLPEPFRPSKSLAVHTGGALPNA